MEVTSLNLRGTIVSSVGPKPQGRDETPRSDKTRSATSQNGAAASHELPRDPASENLAEALRRADPTLDAIQALRVAKRILERPAAPRWETYTDAAQQDESHVELKV